MINILLNYLKLLHLFIVADEVVAIPGSPISITEFGNQMFVSSINPSGIFQIDHDFIPLPTGIMVNTARNLSIWNCEIVASDFLSQSIITAERSISLPGSPEGICEVYWNSDSIPELAVALFDTGNILLLNRDGTYKNLVNIPSIKSLSPCDADNDGDMDIFASACGSGVTIIENNHLIPVIHEIGNIQAGVKKCYATDMNHDDNMDVVGIACASGGVGWWQNPGVLNGNWVYHEIDSTIEGPKDLFCKGDSIVVASMFSEVLTSWDSTLISPSGFTCCTISESGHLVLGHKLGFVIFL